MSADLGRFYLRSTLYTSSSNPVQSGKLHYRYKFLLPNSIFNARNRDGTSSFVSRGRDLKFRSRGSEHGF